MNIVIAIIIFGVIIAIHEFGHFIAAKWCKVRVNEFAIGMGPAIYKKQGKETLYALRLLPIGGFCSMEGEDADSKDEQSFSNKKTWQKLVILAAGAFMNIMLGFIILIILTSVSGDITSTTIAGFYKNAKSEKTGLQVGDTIKKINGANIYIDGDISYQFMNDEDGIFNMEVIRGNEKVELKNVQFETIKDEGTDKNSIIIDFLVKPIKRNFFTVMDYSLKKNLYVSKIVLFSLGDILSGKYHLSDLSGPVGIVDSIEEVIVSTKTFSENLIMILNLAVFITVNVGIFNLLPLPALDGGRIIFKVIEVITSKKVKPEVEGMIHFVGLALLIALMIFVTYNDITKKII